MYAFYFMRDLLPFDATNYMKKKKKKHLCKSLEQVGLMREQTIVARRTHFLQVYIAVIFSSEQLVCGWLV